MFKYIHKKCKGNNRLLINKTDMSIIVEQPCSRKYSNVYLRILMKINEPFLALELFQLSLFQLFRVKTISNAYSYLILLQLKLCIFKKNITFSDIPSMIFYLTRDSSASFGGHDLNKLNRKLHSYIELLPSP